MRVFPNIPVVGITWRLRAFRRVPALIVHGEVRAHHVGVRLSARSALFQEDAGSLHIVGQEVERSVCGTLRDRCPRTRDTTTRLAHIGQVITSFLVLQRRINPNTVLLPPKGAEEVRLTVHIDERVLTAWDFTIRVGKYIALPIPSTKIKDIVT